MRQAGEPDVFLPVLFCSPTMELGVDISALNAVYLRNMPPTPANYAQRSGRAGRSGQAALVVSYCAAQSPHDQYYFERPTAYTFLLALETPPVGADTQFCSTYPLYDALSESDRARYSEIRINASHSKLNAGRLHEGQDEKYPDIPQPLVRTHPLTGRKFLYFSSKLASKPCDMSEADFSMWLTKEIGVAAIPVSAFYSQPRESGVVRFCFAKKEATLALALERLKTL